MSINQAALRLTKFKEHSHYIEVWLEMSERQPATKLFIGGGLPPKRHFMVPSEEFETYLSKTGVDPSAFWTLAPLDLNDSALFKRMLRGYLIEFFHLGGNPLGGNPLVPTH